MKKGAVILILLGIGLTATIYFLPLTPSGEAIAENTEPSDQEQQATQSGDSSDPDFQIDEALRQMQSGELPPMQAVIRIREIAEEHPANIKANLTMGLMSLQTAQFEKAIGWFQKVVELDPQNAEPYRLLGRSYAEAGQADSAAVNYNRALELATPEQKQSIEKEMKELRIN